ncbi:metal-dependent hydrolase [Halostella sp. JP-L12]|uniref:metal-dependent hydrolase n=1 Tax=Halostella TaxID=1843185 RepID=UPI000EF7AE4A|nr:MULTISPECIES: metal-dependent hydrolase [Halostella]NHN48816.1 metal-dependent hydrolase [Halostella sp. JP-L12]
MVDVMGHFGMALLFAIPAWVVWDGRVSLAFIGFTLVTAILPDADLLLREVLPMHHHGVTHTIVFVVGFSILVGAAVEYGLRDRLERQFLKERGYGASDGGLFLFVAGGLFLGGMAHLFADTLSAPDISTPLEPFWPFFDKPYSIDLIWYNDPLWNVGLLSLAVALHLLLAYVDIAIDHPYAITEIGEEA